MNNILKLSLLSLLVVSAQCVDASYDHTNDRIVKISRRVTGEQNNETITYKVLKKHPKQTTVLVTQKGHEISCETRFKSSPWQPTNSREIVADLISYGIKAPVEYPSQA